MSDELVVGLAGGAIGALLTALFTQAARAWAAFGEVDLHDREAGGMNGRLVTWVDDRTRALEVEMRATTTSLASEGQLYSGAHGRALAHAKAKALHEYRDQEEWVSIELARLRSREGAWHAVWRKLRGKPAPSLLAKRQVEPFLDRWREPVTRHSGEITPLDRTRRTLADALDELPSLKLT